jgi:transposase
MPGFFDNLKSGITDKAMEATTRSKEAFESQQVKAKIGDLEGQKRRVLTEIGEAVLAMYKNSAFDQEALTMQCQTVTAVEDQIKEKEAELEAVHQRAEASIAEQHSAAMGSASGAAARAAAGSGFCASCGASLNGAKFCPSCGTKAG